VKNLQCGAALSHAALFLFALLLILRPLWLLFRQGFGGDMPSLGPLAEVTASHAVRIALSHSLVSSALAATLALGLGGLLAMLIGLTDLRGRAAAVFLLLLPMMIPPQVTAIAWVQALGPASPVLQVLGLAPAPGTPNPMYSPTGVILLLGTQQMPMVLLVLVAALRALPRDLAEAARIAGARPARMLARVILPLLRPALIGGWMLAFVSSLGNFGILAVLGIPARYTTLPVLIWRKLSAFGPSALGKVAAISMLLALLAMLAVLLQMRLTRRRLALIGPPQPPLRLRLGPARPLAEAGVALWLAATVALPLAALFATALVPTYGVPLSLGSLTFDHFAEVLTRQAATMRAFANSTLAAGLAALILAVTAVLVTALIHDRGARGARAGRVLAVLADIAHAIPGLVISIAVILAFLRPLPVLHLSLYNTLWIILLAYLCAFLSVALKPVMAAWGQIDPSLEDAARVAGAGWALRMRRVLVPMVAPAAASGAILVFLTAYNEVTVSALLWSSGHETIGTQIFNYQDGGYLTLAAAMSCVTVIATLLLMVLLHLAGRRLPPGVVPWRP